MTQEVTKRLLCHRDGIYSHWTKPDLDTRIQKALEESSNDPRAHKKYLMKKHVNAFVNDLRLSLPVVSPRRKWDILNQNTYTLFHHQNTWTVIYHQNARAIIYFAIQRRKRIMWNIFTNFQKENLKIILQNIFKWIHCWLHVQKEQFDENTRRKTWKIKVQLKHRQCLIYLLSMHMCMDSNLQWNYTMNTILNRQTQPTKHERQPSKDNQTLQECNLNSDQVNYIHY